MDGEFLLSIRRTLYIMAVMITVLPLLLFTFYEYEQVNSRMCQARQEALQEFAFSEGQELLRIVKSVQSQIWSNLLPVTIQSDLNLNDPETRAWAKELLDLTVNECGHVYSSSNKVTDLIIVDSDGVVRISARDDLTGTDISGTSLYEMLRKDGLSMSRLMDNGIRSTGTGVWLTRRVNGGIIVAAFVNYEVFEDRLQVLRLNHTGYAFLLDSEGFIRTYADMGSVNTRVDNTNLASLYNDFTNENRPVTGYDIINTGGNRCIYSYYALPELQSSVIVIQNLAEVLDTNKSFIQEAALTASIFAIISMIILFPYLKHNVISPISMLRDSMARASSGDYRLCGLTLKNEYGELVKGFNHMVSKVSSTLSNLQDANAALCDAEERLRLDKELISISELRFKCATELSTIAVFEINPVTEEFFCSDSWESITTYSPSQTFQREYIVRYIIHPDDQEELIEWLSSRVGRYDKAIRFITSSGEYKWIHVSMAVVKNESVNTENILGTITDIHDSVLAQESATYAAYHETLTGLPRRTLFARDIGDSIEIVKDTNWGAVFALSMDSFKRINDIYGFTVGDQVICAIAFSLRESFGEDMYLARNSGNSFLLYMECPRIMSYINERAVQIITLFCKPFAVNDLNIEVPVHLGAAMYPDHGRTVDELIRNADIAMHEARDKQLKERYSVFDSEMLYKVKRTHQIMEVLRNFEVSKAMYIQYQPIVRASDRTCLAFEALVRMDTSPIGFISPVEFIPLAEQSKLIIPIGTAVLRESCIRARQLLEAGYDFSHISVNVSSVQLEEPDFVDVVLRVLSETGLPNNKLQLEVTESLMIENLDDSIVKLRRLQKCGITIALDDFGTGYSSMKYLRSIPLNVIKIDKHFVDEIEQGVQQLFAFTMIQLSHDIGLSVVAEGVETERQFAMLREHGCDYIQGFCISRPLYSNDLERFLDDLESINSRQA